MYKYETHFHTFEVSSCGKIKAEEGVRLYKEHGYDGIIVTDHFYSWNKEKYPEWCDFIDNFLTGYHLAVKAGKKYGINVYLGAEIRFDNNPNDYLAFGFDEQYLYDNANLIGMDVSEFKAHIKDTDILLFQAHPCRVNCSETSEKFLDGVEIFNGNPRHNSHNDKAKQYAEDNNLLKLSGSDFHQIMDLARGGIETKSKCENINDLVNVIKSKTYTPIEL